MSGSSPQMRTFLFLLFLLHSHLVSTELDANDKKILLQLYSQWSSPSSLTNWGGSSDPCSDWLGVGCSSETPQKVVTIILKNLQLSGALSGLDSLDKLVQLALTSNSFSGTIPTVCNENSPLVYADLSSNQLTGDICAFSSCSKLQYLYLTDNQLGWDGPPNHDLDCFRSMNLLQFYAENNKLYGPTDSFLSNCLGLQALKINHNKLYGGLTYFGTPSSLSWIEATNNQYSDRIDEINSFSLSTLLISDNQVTGSLFKFLNQNPKFMTLDATNNRINDELMWANITQLAQVKLGSLNLNNNLIVGWSPLKSIAPMPLYPRIYAVNNPLWCPVGDQFEKALGDATCENVTLSSLTPDHVSSDNGTLITVTIDSGGIGGENMQCWFTSELDASVVATKAMPIDEKHLSCYTPPPTHTLSLRLMVNIGYSGVNGPMGKPGAYQVNLDTKVLQVWGASPSADEMSVLRDQGTLWPASQTDLHWGTGLPCRDWIGVECKYFDGHITGLVIRGTSLKGPILPHLGELDSMDELVLENVWLIGSLNGTMFPRKLTSLSISSNSLLTGSVPSDLPPHLRDINLSANRLSGDLPSVALAQLDLTSIDLQFNFLSGRIEPLSGLKNVTSISLTLNDMHGSLETIAEHCTSLKTLLVSRNQLSGFVPPSLASLSEINANYNPFWCPIPPELAGKATCDSVMLNGITVLNGTNVEIATATGAIDVDGVKCKFVGAESANVVAVTNAIPSSARLLTCQSPNPADIQHYEDYSMVVTLVFRDDRPISSPPALPFTVYPCSMLNDCSDHGTCVSVGVCECIPPYSGTHCNVLCSKHGHVGDTGQCVCEGAFYGPICDVPEDAVDAGISRTVVTVMTCVATGILLFLQRSRHRSGKHDTYQEFVSSSNADDTMPLSRWNLTIIFMLIIEAFQLIAFQVGSGVPWWDSLQLKRILPSFLLRFQFGSYTIVFWVCVAFVLIWCVAWPLYQRMAKQEEATMKLRIASVIVTILSSAMFLPITSTCIESWICAFPIRDVTPFLASDPEIQCWSNMHIAMMVSGVVCLIVYLPTSVRAQTVSQDREIRAAMRDDVNIIAFSPIWLQTLQIAKFLLAAVTRIFESIVWVHLIMSSVLLSALLIQQSVKPVCSSMIVGTARRLSFSIAVWSCLAAMLTTITQDYMHLGSISLFAGAVVVVALFAILHKKQAHSIEKSGLMEALVEQSYEEYVTDDDEEEEEERVE